jgi:hypothetical protein
MTRDAYPPVGKPMTPEQISQAAQLGQQITSGAAATEAINLYERKCERALLNRGVPAAEGKTQAQFWATLKANSPADALIIGPDMTVDDMMADWRARTGRPEPGTFSIDPATGRSRYNERYSTDSYSALTYSAPQVIMEKPPIQYLRTQGSAEAQLDRFSMNPGEAWFRSIMPGATFAGPAPEMFNSGPLPPITASGLDPSVLARCAWPLRHSAAYTESRARVLMIVEESASPEPDYDSLQIDAGRDALQDYMLRISSWVVEPTDQPIGMEELEQQAAQLWPEEPASE